MQKSLAIRQTKYVYIHASLVSLVIRGLTIVVKKLMMLKTIDSDIMFLVITISLPCHTSNF